MPKSACQFDVEENDNAQFETKYFEDRAYKNDNR